MKHIPFQTLFVLLGVAFLVNGPSPAHATSILCYDHQPMSCALGDPCLTTMECQSGLFCTNGVCSASEPGANSCAAGVPRSCGAGEPCANQINCRDGYTCDLSAGSQTYGTCTANTNSIPEASGPSGSSASTRGSGFTAIAPIPNLTEGRVADSSGLADFLNNLYKYLIGLAAIIAVIEIIIGGLEISTQESVSKHSDGKARIQQALFGLALILSPVLVFSVINPDILDLSITLQNLDTASGVPNGSGTGTGAGGGTIDSSTRCTVNGVAGFFQKAVCPSEEAASLWANTNCTSGHLIDGGCGASNSSGCTQRVRYCQYESAEVVLIDKNPSNGILLSSYLFSPLGAQQASVAEFQRFESGCSNAGAHLCSGSMHPNLWDAHKCADYGGYTTEIPGTTDTERCYQRTLLCSNIGATSKEGYCSPDLRFDPTPFN